MKIQVKIFENPSEKELNQFLLDVDVFSVEVVALPSFNPEEASGGVIFVHVFYRQ